MSQFYHDVVATNYFARTLLENIRAISVALYGNVENVKHKIDSLIIDLENKKLSKCYDPMLEPVTLEY